VMVNVFHRHAVCRDAGLGLGVTQTVLCLASLSAIAQPTQVLTAATASAATATATAAAAAERLDWLLASFPRESDDQHEEECKAADEVGKREEEVFGALFRYYSTFGDKNNKGVLTAAQLRRWCNECGVFDIKVKGTSGRLRPADVDISFTKALEASRSSQRTSQGAPRRPVPHALNYAQTRELFALLGQRLFFPGNVKVFADVSFELMRAELVRGWDAFAASSGAGMAPAQH
jgi:hypothetical protein